MNWENRLQKSFLFSLSRIKVLTIYYLNLDFFCYGALYHCAAISKGKLCGIRRCVAFCFSFLFFLCSGYIWRYRTWMFDALPFPVLYIVDEYYGLSSDEVQSTVILDPYNDKPFCPILRYTAMLKLQWESTTG